MVNQSKTAGIILAAGMSRRLGRPKQLLELGGQPLLAWVVDACLGSQLERLYLIIGHQYIEIMAALSTKLDHPRLKVVINHDYSKGQSTSLRTGIDEIRDDFPSAMFILGDQPLINSEALDLLLERYWASSKNICVPFYKNKRGNPTIFSNRFYDEICYTTGDIGARKIIENNPEQVLKVPLPQSFFFHDIDTERDFEKARSLLADKFDSA